MSTIFLVTCDCSLGCASKLEVSHKVLTIGHVRRIAQQAGWVHRDKKDLCPHCVDDTEEEET